MNKWYMQEAEQNDLAVSTRIRLARNVSDLPFKNKITKKQMIELNERVKSALENINFGENPFSFIYLDKISEIERISLVERHLISSNFAKNPENKMLVLSKDNSISIMVNEEDHIRIQVLSNGLDLDKTYETCNRIDDLLSERLNFAFDEKLGYLTACPTNIGTGLRASVMLHLPGIEKSGGIQGLIKTVSRLGLTIRGSYGEGTKSVGSTYQISNQVTLGLSEKTAISNLSNIVGKIISSERATRSEYIVGNIKIEDQIQRSLGILKYAYLMSSEEFYENASNVRLGISEGIIKNIPLIALNELLNEVGGATICAQKGEMLSPEERDKIRAKIIREKLV